MRARAFAVLAVNSTLAMLAASGCDDPPRTLTAGDVTPIPPGTATGSLFSGDYVVTGGAIEACHCRLGSCATVRVVIGAMITVSQTDGALQVSTSGSTGVCDGAVDGNGAFRCNGEIVQPGDVEYAVAHGQIHTANGQPTSLSETQELTAAVQAVAIDCDIRGTATAQYTGPPTAFLAGGASAAAIGFSLFGP